jgi:hypothetical protein
MPNTTLTLTPTVTNNADNWLSNSNLRAEPPIHHIQAIHLQQKLDGFYLKLDDHWVYLNDGDQLQLLNTPLLTINLARESDPFEPTPLSNLLAESDWKQSFNDKPSPALHDSHWNHDLLAHHQSPSPADILDEYLQEPTAPEPWGSEKIKPPTTSPFIQKIKKIAHTLWE